ncbi:MAG: diguanylate cyclase [Sulfuricurvum sp.]|nr:diguanylate cyclase [Sulfuricurvum sp.]
MHADELKQNFTKRYVLAILLIALLSSAAFYILHFALSFSDSSAVVINISGQQRMLSQRIVSQSQQYYFYSFDKKSEKEVQEIRSALYESMEEMRDANERLSSGKLSNGSNVEISNEIRELYFGQIQLKIKIDEYLTLVDCLLHTKTKQEAEVILETLILSSDAILPFLNTVVAQYQHESEERLTMIYNLEFTAWMLTLFVLMLEVIFIFQPMGNKIRELFQKVVWNRHNLLQEIEIRTLSLEQANEKLAHLASHDPLTGLKNRLNLEEELAGLIKHYKIHHLPYAVVMLDIDWFKKINDTYGHDAGDFVLCELSEIFLTSVRPQDSVYRAGGEEFVIVFNRITQEQAVNKSEKIRQRIQEHRFVYNEHEFDITISAGVYHPDIIEIDTIQEVLKLADNALYEAKRSGRNKIVAVHKELLEVP